MGSTCLAAVRGRSGAFLALAACLLLGTGACNPDPKKSGACAAPQASAAAAQSLSSADTSLAVTLYGPIASAAGANQNMVFSPYSIASIFTMVAAGAKGETARQMQSALELPDTPANLAPAYATLACADESAATSSGNQLSMANAVWAQTGDTFDSTYLSLLQNGYDAPLQLADFMGNAAAATSAIDGWVSTQTSGAIPMLFGPNDIDASTRLVLVNAIDFRGSWAEQFNPNLTSPAPFTLSDGTMVLVPTMNGRIDVGYAGVQNAALYEFPYQGGELAMDILEPYVPLAEFESSLNAGVLLGLVAMITPSQQAFVALPKFSFSTRTTLNPIFASLGMTDVFDPTKADLSGIDGQRDLYVKTAVHQALVEVDEQGTTAAAATGGGIQAGGAQDATIDHPFLFFIRDTKNGSVLFIGRVEDPRQGP